jgi:3-isopropylmalate/(R)-2-methylmalate dehydratase small subunit
MEPFRKLDLVAAPMGNPNIDTDQIIPARYLIRSRAEGFGEVLFHDLRFDAQGHARPQFVLNRPAYAGAGAIVADRNFGCGSSREHAVWALTDYGIRCVIASSFGDILFNNSFKNGMLPIVLPAERVVALRAALENGPKTSITVDLENQAVTGPDGIVDHFDIDPFRKQMLLEGLDEMEFTLQQADAIAAFEKRYDAQMPWL